MYNQPLKPSETTQYNGRGVGFCGILTLIFITLKLIHYIDWSWWWVLAPLWLPIGVLIAFMVVWLLIAVLAAAGVATFTITRKRK